MRLKPTSKGMKCKDNFTFIQFYYDGNWNVSSVLLLPIL